MRAHPNIENRVTRATEETLLSRLLSTHNYVISYNAKSICSVAVLNSRYCTARESYVNKTPTCWHVSTNSALCWGVKSPGRILQINHCLSSLLWRTNILIHLVKSDTNHCAVSPPKGSSSSISVYRHERTVKVNFVVGSMRLFL